MRRSSGTAISTWVETMQTLESSADWSLQMLGYAHAAGFREGPRNDAGTIARYYGIPEDRVVRAAGLIESADRPKILLLQNPNLEAKVGAAVLYPSVWSKAYSRFGNPYGRVHRDFHYQVIFSALAALAEVGCKRMRFENPMSGRPWRRDAYVCLPEATRNIRAHMRGKVSVCLREDEYDPATLREVDVGMAQYDLQEHRPVGISPHIHKGMNMRTVFVERAEGRCKRPESCRDKT